MPDPCRLYRGLRGLADTSAAKVRTTKLRGRDHLVVPVVMLVGDTVIQASNAPAPEYVPAAELADTPGQWDGRPLVSDHPTTGDGSANTPGLYDAAQFGAIFDTVYDAAIPGLRANAYIDVDRAAEIGGDAQSVVTRVQAGELVEVSVGAYVFVEPRIGTLADGTEFQGVWRDLVSNHLAMLPAGVLGACSVEMGCGAPRTAAARWLRANSQQTTVKGGGHVPAQKTKTTKTAGGTSGAAPPARTPPETAYHLSPARATRLSASGISDNDLRDLLRAALGELESDARNVYPSEVYDSSVVYEAWYEDEPAGWQLYEVSYTLDGDGTVTLGDDKRAVKRKTEYVPDDNPVRAARKSSHGNGGFLSRVLATLGITPRARAAAEGGADTQPSDAELRDALWTALFATVPAFDGIWEVRGETVTYSTYPDGEVQIYRRTFTVDAESGNITLNDDTEQGELVQTFRPLDASTGAATPATPTDSNACGCGRSAASTGGQSAPPQEDTQMSDTNTLIGRLAANAACPFDDAQLRAMSAEQVKALDAAFPQAADTSGDKQPADSPPAQTLTPPTTDEPKTVQLSQAEYDDMRAASAAYKRQQDARRSELVTGLSKAQSAYDAAALQAKSLDDLEALATVVGLDAPLSPVSYAGRGLAEPGGADASIYDTPDTYGLRAAQTAAAAGGN